MTTLPSNVGYGTVVGRFLLAHADGDDLDVFPDGVPARGSILLTPSAPYVKNVTASPAPVTILPSTIECPLDSEGYVLGPDNTRGVRLVATNDTDNNPVDWSWRVDFRLTDQSDTPTRGIPTFFFQLAQNTTVDLTTASPVPDSNGVYYLTGPTGPTGATGATGPGVPSGGTANQILTKVNGTDYNTTWSNTIDGGTA
jgi:hypothetical protein